jgi:homogentisate 1,2-dioxygenase
MFESGMAQRVTEHAAGLTGLQKDYITCWEGLERRFVAPA